MPKPIHKYNIQYTTHKKPTNCCVLALDNIMWFFGYVNGLFVGCMVSCGDNDIESHFLDEIVNGFASGEEDGKKHI